MGAARGGATGCAIAEAIDQAAGVMARRSGNGDERRAIRSFARQDAVFHDMIIKFAGNELIRETLATSTCISTSSA